MPAVGGTPCPVGLYTLCALALFASTAASLLGSLLSHRLNKKPVRHSAPLRDGAGRFLRDDRRTLAGCERGRWHSIRRRIARRADLHQAAHVQFALPTSAPSKDWLRLAPRAGRRKISHIITIS